MREPAQLLSRAILDRVSNSRQLLGILTEEDVDQLAQQRAGSREAGFIEIRQGLTAGDTVAIVARVDSNPR